MISSGRRPLSYISMHENAFKKAVAKKNRVYVGNYLPQHPSQISYHDGSRLCGANLKPQSQTILVLLHPHSGTAQARAIFLSGPQSPSYLFLSYNASWVICCFDRRHLGIAELSRRNWGKDAGQCESSDSGKS